MPKIIKNGAIYGTSPSFGTDIVNDPSISTTQSVAQKIAAVEGSKQDKFAVRSVSDTTDNTGYFMVAFPSNVIVLTAWAQQGDCIISFFPSQGADEHGRINWWFRIMNESMQPRTSAPITLYIMYTTY